MPVSICPRCKHVNPEYAHFCHFDGVVLQAQQSAAPHRLPSEFVFPSGRRCNTFDELAQGCQEEWTAARGLLIRGVFAQFFRTCNRADLVRAADDAKLHPNPDIALTTFLTSLPGTRTQTPKLDLSPRRILLPSMLVGATKTMPLTITNEGQSMLQGTVSVTEGQDWLSLSETKPLHEIEVAAVREQVVQLTIHTQGIAAGQTYGAKLTVVTNGGVVEVPLRMDLAAQPFPGAPFQGVGTQRELADKMRQLPKAAVPILESGAVQRWYALNGWTYPVQGASVKGVGGLQQFFEGMGVSKPTPVTLSQHEVRFTCKLGDTLRGQVALQTNVKKWVYAQVKSDSPWLKPLETQVAGPQHALVPFEIDMKALSPGPTVEGKLLLEANGGQKLTLTVVVDVQKTPAIQKPSPAPPSSPLADAPPANVPSATLAPPVPSPTAAAATVGSVKFMPALITTLLVCLALRATLIPVVDLAGRSRSAAAAAEKLGVAPRDKSPFREVGGWLQLPWLPILAGASDKFSARVFQPDNNDEISMLDFRHYFVTYFSRWFVLCTFWLGALVGAIAVVRRSDSMLDLPWGIIAGAVAGCAFSATLAAFFLVAELLPHALWHLLFGAQGGSSVLLWSLLAMLSWFVVGLGVGVILPWIGPLRRLLVDPFQALFAGTFRLMGMPTVADHWAP